jgi:hypothetical protein
MPEVLHSFLGPGLMSCFVSEACSPRIGTRMLPGTRGSTLPEVACRSGG